MERILAATLLCLIVSATEGFLWQQQQTQQQNNQYPYNNQNQYSSYGGHGQHNNNQQQQQPTPYYQAGQHSQYHHQVVNAPVNGYQSQNYYQPSAYPTVNQYGTNEYNPNNNVAVLSTDAVVAATAPVPIDQGNSGPQYQYPDTSMSMGGGNNMQGESHCARFVQGRVYCGFEGVQKKQCEEMRCCWDPRPGQYSCFYHEDMHKMAEPMAPQTDASQGSSSNYLGPVVPPTNQGNFEEPSSDSKVSYTGDCLFHCTSVSREDRRNCIPTSDKNVCTSIGCCFDELETDINKRCFHSNSIKDSCPAQKECHLPFGPKENCGYPDISRVDCEAQGCCYNTISYMATCYKKQYGYVRPKVAVSQTKFTVPGTNKPKEKDYILKKLLALQKKNENTASGTSPGDPQIQQGFVPQAPVVPKAGAGFLSSSNAQPSYYPTPAPAPKYVQQCNIFGCRNVLVSNGQTGGTCFPKKCGNPDLTPDKIDNKFDPRKIVGGSRAFPFSHPWTVMLQKVEGNRTFICGATLICERWLLTAAHCLDQQSSYKSTPDLNPNMYKIYVGRLSGWQSQAGRQVQVFKGYAGIEKLIQHESFVVGRHRGVITHDIALIKLRRPVKMSMYVQPVCLPEESAMPKKVMFATGWGISKNKGPKPTTLKQVGVEIKDKPLCMKRVPGFENQPGVICAGGEPDHDTCTGDSGGPLVGSKQQRGNLGTTAKTLWYLYGLTSIGSPSCNTRAFDRQPALYTDVFYYLNWIKARTNNCCA